jgi:thiol-disulfide isomerase/thioredoxin
MGNNQAQTKEVRPAAKQRRNQLKNGGLAGIVLVILVFAIVFGVTVVGDIGESDSSGRAPDFDLYLFQEGTELGSSHLNIHQLHGKPLVLNFWAGLCPPCRAEMPDLQAFHDDFKEDVTLVGIDVGQFMGLGTKMDAENLLDELNISYPAGFTDDRDVLRDYRVLSIPTTVFIRPDGTIFETWAGALNKSALEANVREMQRAQ